MSGGLASPDMPHRALEEATVRVPGAKTLGLSSLRQIWGSDVLVLRVRQLHPFKDLIVQVQTHTCGHFCFGVIEEGDVGCCCSCFVSGGEV